MGLILAYRGIPLEWDSSRDAQFWQSIYVAIFMRISTKGAKKWVLTTNSDYRWRRRAGFSLHGCSKDEVICPQVVLFSHIGKQVVPNIELGMDMQVDKSWANNLPFCVMT